jgi:hypothetical protein
MMTSIGIDFIQLWEADAGRADIGVSIDCCL